MYKHELTSLRRFVVVVVESCGFFSCPLSHSPIRVIHTSPIVTHFGFVGSISSALATRALYMVPEKIVVDAK